MSNRKKYRRLVLWLLAFSVTALGGFSWLMLSNRIPNEVQVTEPGSIPDFFHSAVERLVQKEVIRQEKSADYQIECSLAGAIPIKTVDVTIVPRKTVYLGGTPVGIYLKTDGVLVVDNGQITDVDGESRCPSDHIMRSGDYIQEVNGERVTTKEELISCLSECGGEDVVLKIDREGEMIRLKLSPVMDSEGNYRLGVWVRNDTQGIGTLTYIEPSGRFGALGHGISDIDTGELLDVCGGTLYDAEVLSIVKGKQGIPGEVSGVIHYSEGYKIGEIKENRADGIYGTVSSPDLQTRDMTSIEVAHKQEIEPGPAVILCSVNGTVQEYEVMIREVRLNGADVNKGMVLEVTDQKLLELTGGIIQGMSGSPILQNGRLVGAVTHVFVQNSAKGYGIFAEAMMEH